MSRFAVIDAPSALRMNVGIFNPRLDGDGSIARRFAESLIEGLSS